MILFRYFLVLSLAGSFGLCFYLVTMSQRSGTVVAVFGLNSVEKSAARQTFLSAEFPLEPDGNPYRLSLVLKEKGAGKLTSLGVLVDVEQKNGAAVAQIKDDLRHENDSVYVKLPFLSSRTFSLGVFEVPQKGDYLFRLRVSDAVRELVAINSEEFRLELMKGARIYKKDHVYFGLAVIVLCCVLLGLTHPANLKRLRGQQ